MANFLSFERLEYYHGKLLDKINSLLSSKADKSEVNDLNEGFSEVIRQMYGSDMTESGAPTIREIATDEATKEGSKVQTNLNTHINDTTPHITAAERTKLSNITEGAQPNQNAFSKVKVGTTTIESDTATDTLEIVAGTGITVTPDETNDKITVTNAGVRSIGTGSTNGTISVNTNGTSANVAVKGLGSAAYTNSSAYDAAGTAQTKADAALASAKTYTNGKIDAIVGEGASETLDTIGEIAAAIEEHQEVTTALNAAIGNKANAADLTSHVNNTSNPHQVTKAQIGLGNVENKSSATIRSELTSSNVTTALGYTPPTADTHYTSKNVVGSSTATSNTTSVLTNGNVYLNSVENNKVTSAHKISGAGATTVTTDTNGNIIISSTDNNTTYVAATQSAAGLMSADDKKKLDGIASGANKITIDTALSSTSGNPVQNKVINTAIQSLISTNTTQTETLNNHTAILTDHTTKLNNITEITTAQIDSLFAK